MGKHLAAHSLYGGVFLKRPASKLIYASLEVVKLWSRKD